MQELVLPPQRISVNRAIVGAKILFLARNISTRSPAFDASIAKCTLELVLSDVRSTPAKLSLWGFCYSGRLFINIFQLREKYSVFYTLKKYDEIFHNAWLLTVPK